MQRGHRSGRQAITRKVFAEGGRNAGKPYLKDRLQTGVWNAQVLLRELRQRNYTGGYTILTDWLRPQRNSASVVAVRRMRSKVPSFWSVAAAAIILRL